MQLLFGGGGMLEEKLSGRLLDVKKQSQQLQITPSIPTHPSSPHPVANPNLREQPPLYKHTPTSQMYKSHFAEVGKVTLKNNGDEALSNGFLYKSNGDEAVQYFVSVRLSVLKK
jgi:hypothetical protein